MVYMKRAGRLKPQPLPRQACMCWMQKGYSNEQIVASHEGEHHSSIYHVGIHDRAYADRVQPPRSVMVKGIFTRLMIRWRV